LCAFASDRAQHIPAGFQVLGHLKTLLILVLGWVYFGEPFFFRTAAGVFLAMSGMILYGRFSSPPSKASSESKSINA